jgi:hypothetical protein
MVPLHVQLVNSTLRGVIKRLRFPLETMLVCVRWYAAYPLSQSADDWVDFNNMRTKGNCSGRFVEREPACHRCWWPSWSQDHCPRK